LSNNFRIIIIANFSIAMHFLKFHRRLLDRSNTTNKFKVIPNILMIFSSVNGLIIMAFIDPDKMM
jgi:hypothetical protein